MRATSYATSMLFAITALACGGKSDDTGDDDDTPDACRGIGCNIVDCGAMGLPPTSITGIVFAPNGTLPLNGVNVYVPVDPLPPFTEGVTCDRCTTTLPGSPVVQTVSDATGAFRLDNVPVGADIPLVITTGKWRRQITIPTINQCTENAIGAADTRLPKNKAEGDIPKIALTTGNADSLECLIRKLGIDDSEITYDSGDGRIHYFTGNGVSQITGQQGAMPNATTLWNNPANLAKYDILFFSCEGAQNQGTKSQAAMDNIEAYTAIGGRVFTSHWHNIWVGGPFQGGGNQRVTAWAGTNSSIASGGLADWTAGDGDPGDPIGIDEVSNPKGTLFADWMVNVNAASAGRGNIRQTNNTQRRTALTLDTARAERWVQTIDAQANPTMGGPQMFQFTTPINVTNDQRCGKVVYTDMHVSGNPGGNPFPGTACGNNLDLSEQEKALAFMFFDIAGCVGGLF